MKNKEELYAQIDSLENQIGVCIGAIKHGGRKKDARKIIRSNKKEIREAKRLLAKMN